MTDLYEAVRLIENNAAAEILKFKRHVYQAFQAFPHLYLQFGFDEEQQKTATAGAENFSAGCACVDGFFIDRIDFRRGNLVRKAAFIKPALMQ